MAEVLLSRLQSAQYDKNIERLGDHSNSCIICGKRVNEFDAQYVHLTTHGTLTDEEVHVDSQGFFIVGPECMKKVKKNFLKKL